MTVTADSLVTDAPARHCFLTTLDLWRLRQASERISRGFPGEVAYLVGSVLRKADYRDVDVRLILDDERFARLFIGDSGALWEIVCTSVGESLARETGLPIDFQIQSQAVSRDYDGDGRTPLLSAAQYAGGIERPTALTAPSPDTGDQP